MKIFVIFLMLSILLPIRAEDWIVEGKTYKDVKVIKVEADAVTILDSNGGGLIPLAKMPPELQKKFGYDAQKAADAAAARKQNDTDNLTALETEANQADAQKKNIIDAEQEKKDEKELKSDLENYYVKILGHVLQKCDGGYLVTVTGNGGGPAYNSLSGLIFLTSSKDLVDGDGLQEDVYPVGKNYSYIDVMGATRTVRKFAESPDEVVKVLTSK